MGRKLSTDTAAVEAEVTRVQALATCELKAFWRETFEKAVPAGLTRDLLLRTLCWHIQQRNYGGHSPAALKILAGYARGRPSGPHGGRRLKPGTEIVREFQGERHTVVVTGGGFRWQDQDYLSLTAIARAITGTNWNGPRFFGLREGVGGKDGAGPYAKASTKPKRTSSVRSGVVA